MASEIESPSAVASDPPQADLPPDGGAGAVAAAAGGQVEPVGEAPLPPQDGPGIAATIETAETSETDETSETSETPEAEPPPVLSLESVLASLAVDTPLAALEVLGTQLDAVREAAGLPVDRALGIIAEIDRAGRVLQRALTDAFLAAPLVQEGEAARIGAAQESFAERLAKGYRMVLESHAQGDRTAAAAGQRLPVVAARAIQAFNLHQKWRRLRYLPVDPALWGSLSRVYELAEAAGCEGEEVVVYPGAWGVSSVRREMLKAMMLAVSSTDALTRVQVEVVERICAQFSQFFAFQAEPSTGVHFRFDLGDDRPPSRGREPGRVFQRLRYFGPGEAAPHLRRLAHEVRRQGVVPLTIDLGQYPVRDVVRVMEHLALYWSATPPARRERRLSSDEPLQVVHGFDQVLAAVDASEFGWDFDASGCERWQLLDESPAGFKARVEVAESRGQWLSHGALVGVRYAEGGVVWGAGAVRRLVRLDDNLHEVGVELLTRGLVRVSLVRLAPDGSTDPQGAVDALLLPSPSEDSIGSVTAMAALRNGDFDLESVYGLTLNGMEYVLEPAGAVHESADYVVGEFRLMFRAED